MCTQCGNEGIRLSHLFGKNFRESDDFTNEIVDLTNFFFCESNVFIFHTVVCGKREIHWLIFIKSIESEVLL